MPFTPGSEQARYDEIPAVLEDSVAKHMRADVTVGAFLSGGIDSTAIAALAIRHNPRLITFTTGFEREGSPRSTWRSPPPRPSGRATSPRWSASRSSSSAAEIVWYLDEPVADPALVPLFFIMGGPQARQGRAVREGADELFGGGYTSTRNRCRSRFRLPGPGVRKSLGKASAAAGGDAGKEPAPRPLTLEERYYGNARRFSDEQLRAVLPDFRPEWTHTDVTAAVYAESDGWDPRPGCSTSTCSPGCAATSRSRPTR